MWNEVQSSNIDAIAHKDDALFVKFKNQTQYRYENVPFDLFENLLAAESVGRTFNESVKQHPERFPYTRVA